MSADSIMNRKHERQDDKREEMRCLTRGEAAYDQVDITCIPI